MTEGVVRPLVGEPNLPDLPNVNAPANTMTVTTPPANRYFFISVSNLAMRLLRLATDALPHPASQEDNPAQQA